VKNLSFLGEKYDYLKKKMYFYICYLSEMVQFLEGTAGYQLRATFFGEFSSSKVIFGPIFY